MNGLRASIHIRKKLKKGQLLKGTGDHEEDNGIADSYIIEDSPENEDRTKQCVYATLHYALY